MIEFKLVLRFFVVCWLFFLNSGAQNRCAQIRYTDVKIGLDWPSDVIIIFISLLYLYLYILLKQVIEPAATHTKKEEQFSTMDFFTFLKNFLQMTSDHFNANSEERATRNLKLKFTWQMKLSQNETSTYIPNHEQNVKCCVYKIEWKLEQPPHTTLPNNFWSPNFKEHQNQLAIPQLEREFRCYWKNISRVWLISYILYLTEELKATTKCLYLRPAMPHNYWLHQTIGLLMEC